MSAGFSLKKIKSKMTLGQRLKRARKRKKVSLIEAEMATKIRAKFLEALEEDDWMNLPADAYAKGFIVRYANYLKLDKEKILFLYQKDRDFSFRNSSELILPKSYNREKRVILTPKILITVSITGAVFLAVGYILFQIYGFAAAPELQVESPNSNLIVDNENIEVKGVTDQDANIFINDQGIPVSSEGRFYIDYKLHKGINVIEIKAKNKVKKEKIATQIVDYQPRTAQNMEE